MSHQAGRPRGRRALPIVASIALSMVALPAFGSASATHAAAAQTSTLADGGNNGQSPSGPKPARHSLRTSAIHPFAITGSAVVTDCSTAGYANNTGGDLGLGAALASAATITFACNPAFSGFDVASGHYIITVPQGSSPAFAFPAGEVASIDGSDGGKNDVTIDGGATYNATTHVVTGGVQIFFVSDASGLTPAASLTLANLTLAHGYASTAVTDGYGGAVQAFGDFSATNCAFIGNLADVGGGALELDARASASVTARDAIAGSSFVGNVGDPLRNADINSFTVVGGGAISVDEDGANNPQSVSIATSTFTANTAFASHKDNGYGGAILVDNTAPGQVAIAGSTFAGNGAAGYATGEGGGYGGALANYTGHVLIAGSTFTGNSTPLGADGAIANYMGGTMAIANSTFTANRADTSLNGSIAGAIFNDGKLTVSFSTIADNGFLGSAVGTFGGGILNTAGGTLTLKANIIARNVAETGADVFNHTGDGSGVVQDQGYNLFSAPGTVVGFTPSTTPPDLFGNPNLATALAYNGGPTPTLRLLPFAGNAAFTANAVDQVPAGVCTDTAGTPLTTDQRGPGFVRPFPAGGNCDIGAFEASILTFGGPFGVAASSCSAAITFFSGGTAFALRTGSAPNTLMSYLSINGPAGTITAVPLVPRAGVPDTLVCTAPDPAAALSPSTATTVTVDAQVVRSTNPSVARLSTMRVVATRTLTGETVTVSTINMDGTTGATLYTLTPTVQPQSFVVRLGTFALFTFATPT